MSNNHTKNYQLKTLPIIALNYTKLKITRNKKSLKNDGVFIVNSCFNTKILICLVI